jgi:hypothetical protein
VVFVYVMRLLKWVVFVYVMPSVEMGGIYRVDTYCV